MQRKVLAFFVSLLTIFPITALANSVPGPHPPDPGCWFLGTELNSFVGVALVSISVGIVLYSRRP